VKALVTLATDGVSIVKSPTASKPPVTAIQMSTSLPQPVSPPKAPGAIAVPAIAKVLGVTAPELPGAAAPVRSRAELRRLFLDQSAVTLGQSWADQWRDDLRREGRPAAGGWPGTLREARVRVEHHLLGEVTRRKMSAVTEAEREVAARRAYASARAQWCRQAEPEAP
jgi:hypothetical protein